LASAFIFSAQNSHILNLLFAALARAVIRECYFMPKAVGEPALEVADFVMHAIGRQARHNLTRRGNFLRDFCAVFHAVAPIL
jgi:hypothetical protein